MRQQSAAAILDHQSEVDIGARRTEGRIGGLGDQDIGFLCTNIRSRAVGHILTVLRLALHINTVGQSQDAGNWAVDVGHDPEHFASARTQGTDVAPANRLAAVRAAHRG